MKVKLEIEFEVPDKLSKFSNTELREAFWEEFLRYAQRKHLEDTLHWHLKATTGDTGAQIISEHHQLWGKYLDKGKIIAFEAIQPAKKVCDG
jgi:hypothetical protein